MLITNETSYLPSKVSPIPNGSWLVLAPHPDDETFGMGGALLLAKAASIPVDIIFVTDGALGGEKIGDVPTEGRCGEPT
jgi:LmbE family N-acetylglucosaminyl deacetylase